MIRDNIEEKEIIEQWLSKNAGRKVEIKTPQKGEKLRLVEMAENNAKITLENKEKDRNEILNELKTLLKLDKLPRKIECVHERGNIKKTSAFNRKPEWWFWKIARCNFRRWRDYPN